MIDVRTEVGVLLARELETFAREIELFPDDQAPWRTPPGITNSAGVLARHVCGNLKHFVGSVLGGSGFVRDRDAEFAACAGSRAELAGELRQTAALVAESLPRLEEAVLARPYPQPVAGVEVPCDRFLLHLCSHLALHLGQAGYLRRVVTGDARSANPVSVRLLA
ncbi:MAG: DinB family protein [Vicinamibacteria bacterium]